MTIVERLRDSLKASDPYLLRNADIAEAANEIERLTSLIGDQRPLPSEEVVTAAAKHIAETVMRYKWDGLREDGRASDAGFDPFGVAHNARQEDYRDVARAVLALLSSPPPPSDTGEGK